MASPQPVPEQEKPLFVRVAEALGCKPEPLDYYPGAMGCSCMPPKRNEHGYDAGTLLRYDTDWAATGPLIERYGITIAPSGHGLWLAGLDAQEGVPFVSDREDRQPLVAVCNLLLALKEAGKL